MDQQESEAFDISSLLELVEERAHLKDLECQLESLNASTPGILQPNTPQPDTTQLDTEPPDHLDQRLLLSLKPHLPHHDFIDTYLSSTEHLSVNEKSKVTEQVISSIHSMVHLMDNIWSEEEVVCAGAWLCAQSVGAESRAVRRFAARALCSLLEQCATDEVVQRVCGCVSAARWGDECAVSVRDASCGAVCPSAEGVRAATRLVVSQPEAARSALRSLRHAHTRNTHAHTPDNHKMMSNLAMLEHFLNVTKGSSLEK